MNQLYFRATNRFGTFSRLIFSSFFFLINTAVTFFIMVMVAMMMMMTNGDLTVIDDNLMTIIIINRNTKMNLRKRNVITFFVVVHSFKSKIRGNI